MDERELNKCKVVSVMFLELFIRLVSLDGISCSVNEALAEERAVSQHPNQETKLLNYIKLNITIEKEK